MSTQISIMGVRLGLFLDRINRINRIFRILFVFISNIIGVKSLIDLFCRPDTNEAGEVKAPADIANRQYAIEVQRLVNIQVPNPSTGDA